MAEKNILLIEHTHGSMDAENFSVECKGKPVEVVRMVCLAMEKYPAIQVCILSAAKNYCLEHNIQL